MVNESDDENNAHPDLVAAAYRVPKIPKFFRNNPLAWFIYVESSFRLTGIAVDWTKVDHVIAIVP